MTPEMAEKLGTPSTPNEWRAFRAGLAWGFATAALIALAARWLP